MERGAHALCSGSHRGTTAHEKSKNGKQENGVEKTAHRWGKKSKYGKKQEGMNKRCLEGLMTKE